MNTTQFTSAELRKMLPILLENHKGVTVSLDSVDSLVDLSPKHVIEILGSDEVDGVLTIHFSQYWEDEEEGWGTHNYYETLQTVEDIKNTL